MRFSIMKLPLLIAFLAIGFGCPDQCKCDTDTADCSGKNFKIIPALEMTQTILYLSRNELNINQNYSILNSARSNLREIYLEEAIDSGNIDKIFSSEEKGPHVDKISLANNGLNKLPAGIFSDLSNLREVDISANNLTVLDTTIFLNNRLLTSINLSKNGLSSIFMVFKGLTELKTLRLSSNFLTAINNEFISLQSLESISLDNNLIQNITDGAFVACEASLQVINLNENKLSDIPEDGWLTKLSVLGELYLRDNELELEFTNAKFRGTDELKIFDLSGNRITKMVHQDFSFYDGLMNLVQLNFSRNFIDEVQSANFLNLVKLRKLDLSFNRISTFQLYSLFGMDTIEEIFMQSNRITAFDSQFVEIADTLRVLDVSNNSFTNFTKFQSFFKPAGSLDYPALETLIANYNYWNEAVCIDAFRYVTTLEIQFAGLETADLNLCENLENVDLSDNEIKTTPLAGKAVKVLNLKNNSITFANFWNFTLLEELNISKNGITNVEEITLPVSIQSLDISENNYTSLNPLDPLPNLQVLVSNQNLLEDFDTDDLENCPYTNLRQLDLSSNDIKNLKIDEQCLPNLEILNLSMNNISTANIPETGRLNEIDLSGNGEINGCGCDSGWFLNAGVLGDSNMWAELFFI